MSRYFNEFGRSINLNHIKHEDLKKLTRIQLINLRDRIDRRIDQITRHTEKCITRTESEGVRRYKVEFTLNTPNELKDRLPVWKFKNSSGIRSDTDEGFVMDAMAEAEFLDRFGHYVNGVK